MMSFVFRDRCDLCGAEHNKTLYDAPYSAPALSHFLQDYYSGRIADGTLAASNYTISQCLQCHFVWQREVLDNKGMQQLYDCWISPKESLEKHKANIKKARASISFQVGMVASLLGDELSGRPIVDYGAGWGAWAQEAKANGHNIHALEFSQSREVYLRSMGIPILGAIEELQQPAAFINFEQVMEHVSSPNEILQSIRPHLADDAIIRMSVPNAAAKITALKKGVCHIAKDALHPLEHINAFTPRTLNSLATRHGFVPLSSTTVMRAAARLFVKQRRLGPALRIAGAHSISTSRYFRLERATR